MSEIQEYDLTVLANAKILTVFKIMVTEGEINENEIGFLVKSPMVDDKLVAVISEGKCKIVKYKDYVSPYGVFVIRKSDKRD